jgi:hypothetical protein
VEKAVLKTRMLLVPRSANSPQDPLIPLKPQIRDTPMAHEQSGDDLFRRSPGNLKKKAQHGAGPFLVKLWDLTTRLYIKLDHA